MIIIDRIPEILKNYSFILAKIEQEKFTSEKSIDLQKKVANASIHIKKISVLFANLDSIQNMLGAIFINGLFLSHIHTLQSLINWKKNMH